MLKDVEVQEKMAWRSKSDRNEQRKKSQRYIQSRKVCPHVLETEAQSVISVYTVFSHCAVRQERAFPPEVDFS